jgi:hypothetical protein
MRTRALAALLILTLPVTASASETIGYGYDALGRLVRVDRTGSVNNNVNSAYHYDQADNRAVRWTGSGAAPAAPPLRPPFFTVSDATIREVDLLVFKITKSGSANATYTVNFGTVAGTAASGGDFQGVGGTLTFGPGEYEKTVLVPTIDDGAYEGDETLYLDLFSASGGAPISRSRGTGKILDDDSNNQSPIAALDNATATTCSDGVVVDVVANDSDPDGNYPLTLVGIQSVSLGGASVENANSIRFASGSQSGTARVVYIISDDAGGIATGTLSVRVTGSGCQ